MNKFLIAAVLACAAPLASIAQEAAKAPAKPAAAAAAKPAAKPAQKAAPKSTQKSAKASQHKPQPKLARSAVKAVEAVTPIDPDTDVTLSAEELEIAQRVFVGSIRCELGNSVTVTADEKRPGFFDVQIQRTRYRMHPVTSRTGAIRLEDPRAGALWIQLGNKSMLMNQKLGQRLADDCQSPQQTAMAEELKKNPPQSLWESKDPATKN